MPNLVAEGQSVWALVGVPKIWRRLPATPLGWSLSDPVETRPSLLLLPPQIWSFYVKLLVRNYRHPPKTFDPLRPAFQGHSRSVKPTRIDRSPVTSVYSNYRPLSYCFRDEARYC